MVVTGASGFIGSRFVDAAVSRGHEVVTVTRADWHGPPLVPREHRYFGRLPFMSPGEAFRGADAVVHLAAISHPDWQRSYAINVLGTASVAREARRSGVRTFLFVSSQSARADTSSPYGRSKDLAERAVLEHSSGMKTVIVRPGLVCGAGGLFGRIAAQARRLPVIPVFAGEAVVQPILVDDLVVAMLHLVDDRGDETGRTFHLGMPNGLPLREFVRLIARDTGSRRAVVDVPLTAVSAAVGIAERLRIPLPLSSATLAGMREVRAMDTAGDMERLEVPRRTAAEIVHRGLAPEPASPAGDEPSASAARVLLVGAGRIGFVHALTLSRLPSAVLSGIADPNARAVGLLASAGVRAPTYPSIEAALAGEHDAAVIATPPSTHLALATACVERGLRVLIEKPACPATAQLEQFDELASRAGDAILVGYLLPRTPSISAWIARIRSGEFGRVLEVRAYTLLSLIDARSHGRWETRPDVSGGGVLANSGTHVLSVIHELFGAPREIVAQTLAIHSTEVEDSAIVRYEYDDFSVTHYASWSIGGYGRQENRVTVRTEQGIVTLTASACSFEGADGAISIHRQSDDDVGFNLAPDYAGGGIAVELRDLAGRAPVPTATPPVTLARALKIERLLHRAYGVARSVSRFSEVPAEIPSASPASVAPAGVILDLRELGDAIARGTASSEAALLIRMRQLPAARRLAPDARISVGVPDFLGQSRLLAERRYGDVLRAFGPRGTFGAARAAVLGVGRERRVGFWVAVRALLEGELAALPRRFEGTLLVHPYVVDLALAVDAIDTLDELLGAARRKAARIGLHSNLARDAANVVGMLRVTPDVLCALASPNGDTLAELRGWLDSDERTRSVQLWADVGPAPLALHRRALADITSWRGPAEQLVADGRAVGPWDGIGADVFRASWAAAFPGAETDWRAQ